MFARGMQCQNEHQQLLSTVMPNDYISTSVDHMQVRGRYVLLRAHTVSNSVSTFICMNMCAFVQAINRPGHREWSDSVHLEFATPCHGLMFVKQELK